MAKACFAVGFFMGAATAFGACTSDESCSLNGVCSNGACVCDAAWEGVDCGQLAFKPSGAHRIYSDDGNISSWGGVALWDNETERYHLFASEFAKGCSLGQWSPNSQVIRAEAAQWSGPYVRKEVVLPPFHHNPTVVRALDGTWLLYVIGRDVPDSTVRDCEQSPLADPAPGNMESNITLFSSSSPLGPWQRVGVVLAGEDAAVWDADRTNPTAYVDSDGSVRLMYRGCGERCGGGEHMGLAIAPHWNCSVDVPGGCRYERQDVGAPLWGAGGEDPFLFRDPRGGWHALIHALSHNGGFGCNNVTWRGCDVGGHAFSSDGLSWTLSATVPYTTNVTWTDGTSEVLNRRERPQLIFAEDGVTPIALTNGVQRANVPASCSKGGTVTSPLCRSFTMAVSLQTQQRGVLAV